MGTFNRAGLVAMAEIFGQVEFKDVESHGDAEGLTEEFLKRLIAENLPTDAASDDHVGELYRTWQMPMYNLDFRQIDVPLPELQRERDALLSAEIGSDSYLVHPYL